MMNPEQMQEMAEQAKSKKGAMRVKDPIQAEKMKQSVQQTIHQMTGAGTDVSQYPPEMRKQILRQRLAQKKYMIGMQRANMGMRQQAAEQMEERMKTQMTAMQQMQAQQQEQSRPLTEEEERRRKLNQKKRQKKKEKKARQQQQATNTAMDVEMGDPMDVDES